MNTSINFDQIKREGREVIFTTDCDQSIPLISFLISHANDKITIYSKSLNSSVYVNSEVIYSLVIFLMSNVGATLDLIVEDDTLNPNNLIEQLKSFGSLDILKKVRVFKADAKISEKAFNFMLVDNDSFRFVTNKQCDISINSFNHKKSAGDIKSLINKWFESAGSLTPVLI